MTASAQRLVLEIQGKTDGAVDAARAVDRAFDNATKSGQRAAQGFGAAAGAIARQFSTLTSQIATAGTAGAGGLANLAESAASVAAEFGVGGAIAGGLTAGAGLVLAIGTAGVIASEKVETSMRAIRAQLPKPGEDLTPVRDVVRDLSEEFGDAASDVAKFAEANAAYSKSAGELANRTRAVFLAAKATGSDPAQLAGGLDLLADAFNLSGKEAGDALAKLAAYSRGATQLTDSLSTLQAAAPALQKAGVSFDVAAKALVTIGEQSGDNAKQAAKRFKELAEGGADGARQIRELAAAVPTATNALADLEERAKTRAAGLGDTVARIGSHINTLLRDIGEKFAPLARAELEGILGVVERLDGTTRRQQAPAQIATVSNFGDQFQRFPKLFAHDSDIGKGAQKTYEFAAAVNELGFAIRTGDADLAKLTDGELRRLLDALTIARTQLKTFGKSVFSPEELASLDGALTKVRALAKARADAAADDQKPHHTTTPPSAEEQAAALTKASSKLQEIGSALQAARLELTSFADQGDPIAQLNDKFAKLGKTLTDIRAKIPTGTALDEITAKLPSSKVAPVRAAFAKQDADVAGLQQALEIEQKFVVAGAQFRQALEAQGAVMQIVGTAAQLAAREVDTLVDNLFKAGASFEDIDEAKRLVAQFNAAKLASDDLRKSLTVIDQLRLTPLERAAELTQLRTEKETALANVQGTSLEATKTRAVIEGDIAAIDERILKVQDENDARLKAMNENASRFVVQLDAALSSAFGISSALLGSDATLTKMLGGALQLSDGLRKAVDAVGQLKPGAGITDLFSNAKSFFAALPGLGQALGGAIGIASTVSGLFGGGGESPEQQAQREELAKNTQALEDLRTHIGDLLNVTASGKTLATIRDVPLTTQTEVGRDETTGEPIIQDVLRSSADVVAELQRMGVGVKALKDIGASFGLTVSDMPTVAEIQAVQDAIRNADLHAFFDTFAGDLERLDANDQIHGITDPIDKLIERATLLASKSPIFAKIFDGLDLHSAEGMVEAQRRLREQWDRFLADPEAFKAELDASGMSLEEWKQQMLAVNAALDASAIALQHLSRALDIQHESFALNDTPAKDQVAALIETYTAAFSDAFKGISTDSSLADVRAAANAFLKQAGADGVLDDTEKAILEGFQAIIGAMKQADADATAAAEKAKQDAADHRQKIIDTAKQKIQIDDITDPKEQTRILLEAYKKAFPKLGELLGEVNLDDPDGITKLKASIRRVFDALTTASEEGSKTAQATADELKKGLHDLLLGGDIGDPAQAAGIADRFNALSDALKGTDEGASQSADALADLFTKIANGEDVTAELGGATLPEFIQALLDLDGATDAAQQGVASLADTLAGVFSDIDLDARIFGESAESVLNKKLAAIGVHGDAATEAGRAQAIAELRALATANPTDDKLRDEIATLIQALQQLSSAATTPDAAGGADGGSVAGSTEARGVLATGTVEQFDQVIGLLSTMLVVQRQIEANTHGGPAISPTITSVLAPLRRAMASGPIPVPALPPAPAVAAARVLAASAGDTRRGGSPVLAFSADFSGGIEVKSLEDLASVLTRKFLDALLDAVGKRELEAFFNLGSFRPASR